MKYLSFFIALVLSISHLGAAESICDAILKDGVFDSIIRDESSNSSESHDEFFCSKDFESYVNKRKDGANFGITINGSPLTFGANSENEDSMKRRNELCRSVSSNVTKADYVKYSKKEANKDILIAWTKCVDTVFGGGNNLVTFRYNENDDIVILSAKFNGVTGLAPPKVKKLLVIGSLECTGNSFLEGEEISYEIIRDYCVRKSDGAATVILKTTLGDYQLDIPAKEKKLIPIGNYILEEELVENKDKLIGTETLTIKPEGSTDCFGSGRRRRCAAKTQFHTFKPAEGFHYKTPELKCISTLDHNGPCEIVSFQVASSNDSEVIIKTVTTSPHSDYFKIELKLDKYKKEEVVAKRVVVTDGNIFKDVEFFIENNSDKRLKLSGQIMDKGSFDFYVSQIDKDSSFLDNIGLSFVKRVSERLYFRPK